MFINLKKTTLVLIVLGLCSVASIGICADASASESITPVEKKHVYISAFGGRGTFFTNSISQTGTAFLSEFSGGPLAVDATGGSAHDYADMLGMNIGYRFSDLFPESSAWNLTPALELEGYYLHGTLSENTLVNDTTRLDAHEFDVTYPMNTGVYLINGVLNLNHGESKFHPYFGLGIGPAFVSINNAMSTQVDPDESGVNHYNSNPDSSSWTFATQAKLGLSYEMSERVNIFAEYRFLYLAASDYTFGSTQYSGHVETTSWNVNIDGMYYNMFVAGVQFNI